MRHTVYYCEAFGSSSSSTKGLGGAIVGGLKRSSSRKEEEEEDPPAGTEGIIMGLKTAGPWGPRGRGGPPRETRGPGPRGGPVETEDPG